MKAILNNKKINLLLNSKESLEYLLKFEPSFPRQSEMTKLISIHLLENKYDVISESDVEFDFIEVNPENIESSNVNGVSFIVSSILGDFSAEVGWDTVKNSGILIQYSDLIIEQAMNANLCPLSLSLFKDYVKDKDVETVFKEVLAQEIKLSCIPGDALAWLASVSEISVSSLTAFVLSEYFSPEYSSILIAKEDFIIDDAALLISIINKNVGEDAQKVLYSRYKEQHPELPEVQPIANLPEIIESSESYADYKDKLFHRKLIIAKKDYSLIDLINLDVEPASLSELLFSFIRQQQVSDKELTDYVFRSDALPGINSVIIDRTDYLILDIFTLNKMSDLPVLEPETIEVLSARYEAWFSKDKQTSLAIEFQKYDQELLLLPRDRNDLSMLIEKSKVLYSLVSKIDPSIKNGIFKNGEKLSDCEFDEMGFPLVAQYKLDRVLMRALKLPDSPSDLVLYIHNLEHIPWEFKLPEVLGHPSCPLSLLRKYAEDKNSFILLLRNPALPQEILVQISDNLSANDTELFKMIVNHPNCSAELKQIILAGYSGYLNKIKTSEDEDFLSEQTRRLIVYPQSWKERFELSTSQKHQALREIMDNIHSPFEAIDQLLEFYAGFETDPSELMVQMRASILKRKDCPKSFLSDMINSGFESIRLEAIRSEKITDDDLLDDALTYAMNDFQESIGEYNMSSLAFLENYLSIEIREIIKHAPFPERIRSNIKEQIMMGLKKDIEQAEQIESLTELFIFLNKHDKFCGELEIAIEEKNELLRLLQSKVLLVQRA